jgi:hypothetical protein
MFTGSGRRSGIRRLATRYGVKAFHKTFPRPFLRFPSSWSKDERIRKLDDEKLEILICERYN